MKPSPQNLKQTNTSAAHSTPVRLSAMFGGAVLAFGLSLTTVGFLAPGAASAAPVGCSAPTGTGLQKNINTTEGCDVVDGTSLMTGYIADTGLSAGESVTLTDGYEGLSSHNFYFGTYVLDLACSTGSVSPAESTYVVEEGTGSYPGTAPTISSGTLPVVSADSSGNFVCTWALSVENAPSGQLNSSRNDLWSSAGDHTATASVKPPVITSPPPPTTTVPPTTVPPTTVPPTTVPPTTVPPTTVPPTTVPPTTVPPTTVPPTTVPPTTVPPTTVPPTTVPPTTVPPTTVPPTTVPPTTVPPTTVPPTTVDPTTTTIPPTSSTLPQDSTTTDPVTTTTIPRSSTTTGSSTTVAPVSTVAPAATTAAPAAANHPALAFTGSDTRGLVIGGLLLMSLGGLIVRASRRGQRSGA